MVLTGWNIDKRYRFLVEAGTVAADLTDIPVMLNLGASSGKYSYDITTIFDELGPDYRKIAVEYGNSGSQCFVEVEKWGSFTQIPQASGTNIGQENPAYTGGAFDGVENNPDATGSWYAYVATYVSTGWVGKDYGGGTSYIVQRCDLLCNGSTYDPKDFTIDGSNNGTDWVVLHSVLGEPMWTTSVTWKSYEFYNTTPYRYYRLNVTANWGSGYLVVMEIKFYYWINDENAVLWVKVPTLYASESTLLYLYYDVTHEDNDIGDVVLLLTYDGADESQLFFDYSPFPKGLGAVGSVKHDSAQAKFGSTSMKSATGSNYIVVSGTNTDLSFSGDFTIHYWVYPSTGSHGLVNYSSTNKLHTLYMDSATSGRVLMDAGNVITGLVFPATSWSHYALTRAGNTICAYVNGVLAGTGTKATTIGATTTNYLFGDASGHTMNGWVDSLVIIKGKALWQGTSSFTPPTAPPEIKYIGRSGSTAGAKVWENGYVLVGHLAQDPISLSNNIIDSTIYRKAGKSYGSMLSSDSVTSSGTIGYGIDFDGSNDYINFGYDTVHNITTTLTLEAIIKPNTVLDSGLTTNRGIISRQHDATDNQDTYGFFINPDGKLQLDSYGGSIQSTLSSWGANTPYYIAGTYSSTSLSGILFVNGVSESLSVSTYNSMAGSASNNLVVGKHADASEFFPGIIDEVRVSNCERSSSWLEAIYLSSSDLLGMFSSAYAITYSGAEPCCLEKMYGKYQTLRIIPIVDPFLGSYCDLSFYLGSSFLGSTYLTSVSGVLSGTYVEAGLNTISGTGYSWYVTGVVSGTGASVYSSIYDFYVRYLCSGTCSIGDTTVSGALIYLHNRDTGEYLGTTTTAGEGTFQIDSTYGGNHYVVALHPDEAYNGLVYDRIVPE